MNYIMRGIQTLKESFFLGRIYLYCNHRPAVSFQKAQKSLVEMHFRGDILHLLRYSVRFNRNFYIALPSERHVQL